MATDSSIGTTISSLPSGKAAQAVRKNLTVMLLASAALMMAWSFALPVFEGPDEPAHWQYACYLHQNRALPVYGPSYPEAFSPPLYYLLIAPFALDAKLPPAGYPGAYYMGRPFFPPRVFQNASGDFGRYWPFRVARLVSVLISVFTIWLCALAGTEASGSPWTGLLVGGLVAFWPMFTFRGMNVSNDALMAMFSALALYLVVRLTKHGFTWGIGTFSALAVAGAFLSKINAIILPVPLLLTVISEKTRWRAKLLRVGVLLAIMLVIVAPWLIRNQQLYGDLLAQKALVSVSSALGGSPVHKYSLVGSDYIRMAFPISLIMSFIGTFGWMSIPLPAWAYLAYMIAIVTAGFCWLEGVQQRRIDFRLSAILCSAIVLNLMAVVHLNLTFAQPQGRYMLPTLPALALLLGLGLGSLRSWSKHRTLLTVGGLAVSNVVILVALVIPAYWPPVIK